MVASSSCCAEFSSDIAFCLWFVRFSNTAWIQLPAWSTTVKPERSMSPLRQRNVLSKLAKNDGLHGEKTKSMPRERGTWQRIGYKSTRDPAVLEDPFLQRRHPVIRRILMSRLVKVTSDVRQIMICRVRVSSTFLPKKKMHRQKSHGRVVDCCHLLQRFWESQMNWKFKKMHMRVLHEASNL